MLEICRQFAEGGPRLAHQMVTENGLYLFTSDIRTTIVVMEHDIGDVVPVLGGCSAVGGVDLGEQVGRKRRHPHLHGRRTVLDLGGEGTKPPILCGKTGASEVHRSQRQASIEVDCCLVGSVFQVGEELDLYHRPRGHAVHPPPDVLAGWRESALLEGSFEVGCISRTALDLQIDLDVDVRCSDVLVGRPGAQQIRYEASEQYELGGLAVGGHEANEGGFGHGPCLAATWCFRHRDSLVGGVLPRRTVRLEPGDRHRPGLAVRRGCHRSTAHER